MKYSIRIEELYGELIKKFRENNNADDIEILKNLKEIYDLSKDIDLDPEKQKNVQVVMKKIDEVMGVIERKTFLEKKSGE